MRALVTGVAGQDGTILSTLLTRAGHDVVGLIKPGTDVSKLLGYVSSIELIDCDLSDDQALRAAIIDVHPDQIYNLGGFTAPGESWDHVEEVRRVNVDAVRVILDAMRSVEGSRLFQASSASVFEGTDVIPQTEQTWLSPKTPYAKSKADAMSLVESARSDWGLFAASGILYNHESPLRGAGFVTRRVTMAVAAISAGLQDHVELGDIEVARDWGWAPDYVRGMMLMLSADTPKDYVLATGISHRLAFFIEKAFLGAGIKDWRSYVVTASDRTRAGDTNKMVGDSRAAYKDLGWRHTTDFDSMALTMVQHDLDLLNDPDAVWTIA